MKIAIYFCECGNIISEKIDIERVKERICQLPDVSYFKKVGLACSSDGKNFLAEDLKKEKPDRVIIAACSPRAHENTFKKILSEAGINPYYLQMANVREQIAWVIEDKLEATAKAISYLKAAIFRARLHKPLEKIEIDMSTDVIVIGAGPAGLLSALNLAKAGRKVVIVEKTPLIGGAPVKFEEVFPNLECGPCMLEPVMNDVLHGNVSENIEILTLSEVDEVTGFYGNFNIKIKQKARHVDIEKCIGCGVCVEVCPATNKNSFNCNLSDKKAISFPFLGALPYAPYIDDDVCIRNKGQECTKCKEACLVEETILYEEEEKILERKAGAIIVAIGSEVYDCSKLPGLGHKTIDNIYNSEEFERVLASNGPFDGQIKMVNGESPKNIAIIHCVGSLDKEHKEYCSGICCQSAFKFNHIIQDKLPDVKITHFYKELSVSGKEAYNLYSHVKKDPKTDLIRYKDIKDLNVKDKNGKANLEYKDINNNAKEIDFDMAILCSAVTAPNDTDKICELLEISKHKTGFFEEMHSTLYSTESKIKGIYLAGSCIGPKAIQGAVNDGMSASGAILMGLIPGKKLEIEPITASIHEKKCAGCKICIGVCPYKAITFDDEKNVSVVNTVLCHGCGTCVAACPSGAIEGNHFTMQQIYAEIKGMLV
jgi:heterodisulfide reductase subunit A2